MICKACGAEIADGARVCSSCGATQTVESTNSRKTAQAADDAIDFGVTPLAAEYQHDSPMGFEVPSSNSSASVEVLSTWSDDAPEYVVPAATAVPPAISSAEVAYDDSYDADDEYDAPEERPAGKRYKVLAICVAAVLLCGAGIAYAVISSRSQDAAQAPESSRVAQEPAPSDETPSEAPAAPAQTHEVTVPITAEGLTDAGSRIPAHVQGTADGGNAIDQDTYLSFDGKGLSLAAGTYEIRILESPIAENGTLYLVPGDTRSVKVEADGTFAATPSEPFVLEPIPAADTTDEQIEAAVTWVLNDPERSAVATTLREAAYQRRNDSLEAIEAENEKTEDETTDTEQSENESQWHTDNTYEQTSDTTSDTDYDGTDYYGNNNDYDTTDNDSDTGNDGTDSNGDGSDTNSGDSGDTSEGGGSDSSGDSSGDTGSEGGTDGGAGGDNSAGSDTDTGADQG